MREGGGVVEEVEEGCGEDGGGGVGACDYEDAGFAEQLVFGEAFAGFGVAGLQEVGVEVADFDGGVVADAFVRLGFAVGFEFLHARVEFVGDDFCEVEFEDAGHVCDLGVLILC